MKKFIVSLFYRQITNNQAKERLWHNCINANSIEEALGKAVTMAEIKFPGFDLVYHVETEI